MEAESTENLAAASEAAHLTPAFWLQWLHSHRELNSSGSGAYDPIRPAAKALATLPPCPIVAAPRNPTTLSQQRHL